MVDINLVIESLSYVYQKQTILNSISLELNNPQTITLLGPNGAGKSTLLKTLAAILYGQSGRVILNQLDAELNRKEYQSQIGYMPETALIMPELTVREQLKLLATINQINESQKAIDSVINRCQLQAVVNKRTHKLSLGYKQRLNLAQALLNDPKVLILDEPLNGLDPHLIIEFRSIINKLKNDVLVIMSTHYLAEAQLISDRVLIMKNGHIIDDIEIKNIKSSDYDLEKVYLKHMENNT